MDKSSNITKKVETDRVVVLVRKLDLLIDRSTNRHMNRSIYRWTDGKTEIYTEK